LKCNIDTAEFRQKQAAALRHIQLIPSSNVQPTNNNLVEEIL